MPVNRATKYSALIVFKQIFINKCTRKKLWNTDKTNYKNLKKFYYNSIDWYMKNDLLESKHIKKKRYIKTLCSKLLISYQEKTPPYIVFDLQKLLHYKAYNKVSFNSYYFNKEKEKRWLRNTKSEKKIITNCNLLITSDVCHPNPSNATYNTKPRHKYLHQDQTCSQW